MRSGAALSGHALRAGRRAACAGVPLADTRPHPDANTGFLKDPCDAGDLRGGFFLRMYVREPCEEVDAAARFFLHLFSGAARTNLDFDFKQRGVLTDGRCVALAPLPEQDIDRIRTGQFTDGEGELWSVEL